jgi:hypothetical protein
MPLPRLQQEVVNLNAAGEFFVLRSNDMLNVMIEVETTSMICYCINRRRWMDSCFKEDWPSFPSSSE